MVSVSFMSHIEFISSFIFVFYVFEFEFACARGEKKTQKNMREISSVGSSDPQVGIRDLILPRSPSGCRGGPRGGGGGSVEAWLKAVFA